MATPAQKDVVNGEKIKMEQAVHYTSLKSINSRLSKSPRPSPKDSRQAITIPTFTRIDDESEGDDEGEEENEDTSIESLFLGITGKN